MLWLLLATTVLPVLCQNRQLRILTYNLRYGELANMETIAQVIRKTDPDIVALQEVEVKVKHRKTKASSEHFIALLSQHTGMHGIFAKAIDAHHYYIGIGKGEFGNAILSRYSFDYTRRNAYQAKGTETRVALEAGITLPDGSKIKFVSTHLDHNNNAVRKAQVEEITALFGNSDTPTILAGDFNERPKDANGCINTLCQHFVNTSNDDELTFIAWNPYAKLDYVFCRPAGAWRVIKTEVIPETSASDHRPLLVTLEFINTTQP